MIFSEKNKTLFIIDGYKFRYHKTLKNDSQRWSCCKKTFKSYIKLNNKNEIIERAYMIIILLRILQNYLINRRQLSNNLKGMTVEKLYDKLSKLIYELYQKTF